MRPGRWRWVQGPSARSPLRRRWRQATAALRARRTTDRTRTHEKGSCAGPLFLMRGLPLLLVVAATSASAAEPSVSVQSGLISMPDARFAPEGSWRTGLSFMRPYQTIWAGITLFPWLETSFRYTRIYHVPS